MATSRLKWVLVAGTGARCGLPDQEVWCAEGIGEALARHDYGLVVGGWHGVDYIAADSFARGVAIHRPLSDALIQVVPRGSYPEFRGGHVIHVDEGPAEWVQGLRYADAVVLIGGEGATYETYLFALQERRPVFPIAGTGRDASRAYERIISNWERSGGVWWGITRSAFSRVLGRPITSRQDAQLLTDALLALCADHFRANDPDFKLARKNLFVCYSHEDREWLVELKRHLSGLPSDRLLLWDDTYIEPGTDWDLRIHESLLTSSAAVLLVTPAFWASEYITRSELPRIMDAARSELMTVFWVHVKECHVQEKPISKLQAAHDVGHPLSKLSPAARNEVWGQIARKITGHLRRAATEETRA